MARPVAVDAGAVTVAVLATAAGAIHVAVAPIHAPVSRQEAFTFAICGVVQFVAGGLALTKRRPVLLANAALGAVTAVAWAWSRRWGLPLGFSAKEEAGVVDGLCAGIELATVAVALTVALGWWPRPWRLRHAVPFHAAVAVAVVAVLAAPSTIDHAHEHGTAAAAGHDHGAAGGDCPEAGHPDTPVTDPPLHFDGPRLDATHAAALTALAATSPPLPCGASAVHHSHGAPTEVESPLPPDEQATFDQQWAAAQAAAARLSTPEAAAAAGYTQASPQAPGVGTHWIDWTAVDAPFDPARPSMLLFDQRPGHHTTLVGFSYWTRSAPGAPDGFAGPNDVWHQHVGLCFVDGWLFQEGVPSKDDCAGDWLAGTDLWMLHAWVVPSMPNPDGRFAGRLQALCPGDNERIADALTCDPAGF